MACDNQSRDVLLTYYNNSPAASMVTPKLIINKHSQKIVARIQE